MLLADHVEVERHLAAWLGAYNPAFLHLDAISSAATEHLDTLQLFATISWFETQSWQAFWALMQQAQMAIPANSVKWVWHADRCQRVYSAVGAADGLA